MTAAIIVYVLAAIPAFILWEGVLTTPCAVLAAILWPLWPALIAKEELSIWLAARAYDRRERARRAKGD